MKNTNNFIRLEDYKWVNNYNIDYKKMWNVLKIIFKANNEEDKIKIMEELEKEFNVLESITITNSSTEEGEK